jgi:hypothetical protein
VILLAPYAESQEDYFSLTWNKIKPICIEIQQTVSENTELYLPIPTNNYD